MELLAYDQVDYFIPNFVARSFLKQYSGQQFVTVEKQMPPPGFLQNGLASSFVVNIQPLFLFYLVYLALVVVTRYATSYNVVMLYAKLHFKFNVPIALFLFTFKESVTLFCLQVTNLNFSNTLNIFSAVFMIGCALAYSLYFRMFKQAISGNSRYSYQ